MNTEQVVAEVEAPLCWRKSSHSSEEGGECVEVAIAAGAVHIRDSKQPAQDGPVLRASSAAWSALLAAM